MRVLLATTNRGKIAELERLLSGLGLELTGLDGLATDEEIETGVTFAENALLKAHYYHDRTGLPTISDDSGLEVDMLGGAPGVYSARYGGPGLSDAERVDKLLEELRGVPEDKRGAQFVCVAALVWAEGHHTFTETARGHLLDAPRGTGGFGYDPIFYYQPLGRTFAELAPDEKAEVSHRGKAFRLLAGWLKRPGVLDTVRAGDKINNSSA